MQRFGEKLQKLRIQHGLTLSELARAIGYTAHGYISEMETGKKRPSIEFILAISRLFGVSTDQLLKDELALELKAIPGGAPTLAMSLPFVHRPPTDPEFERLRLILSTYQDGTGQQARPGGRSLPNWRDFERSVAAAFGGQAQESKAVFDVLVPDPQRPGLSFGISCKMRRALNDVTRTGRVVLELSNSSGKFWAELAKLGLTQGSYRSEPSRVGQAVVTLYEAWHQAVSLEAGGSIDLSGSFYLALMWNEAEQFQLFQLPLHLPDPASLTWQFPPTRTGTSSRRLVGKDDLGTVLEWYGESGAQLKYYPLIDTATWSSDVFQLEPLPDNISGYGIVAKAAAYFPNKWQSLSESQ